MMRQLELVWLITESACKMLTTAAGVTVVTHVYSQITTMENAWSAVVTSMLGFLVSRVIQIDSVGNWLVKYAMSVTLIAGVLELLLEMSAVKYPAVYITAGYGVFTVTGEFVGFVIRWFKNRIMTDPDRRTLFETRRATWFYGATGLGALLGFVPLEVWMAVVVGVLGYSISTIGMLINIRQMRRMRA